MHELKKKIGKVLTSKSVGTGPSSYEKRIYKAAVRRFRNTALNLMTHGTTQPVSFPLPRFVDQSPSRETDSHLLWDQKVHCHIHNSPSLYFVTSFCSVVGCRHLLYAGSTPFVFHQQLSFVVIQLAACFVALCRYQTTLQNEDDISSCYRQQYVGPVAQSV